MVSLGEGALITPARLLLGVWPHIASAGARALRFEVFLFCGESDASKPIVTGGAITRNDDVCRRGGFHGYKLFICKALLSLCLLSVVQS